MQRWSNLTGLSPTTRQSSRSDVTPRRSLFFCYVRVRAPTASPSIPRRRRRRPMPDSIAPPFARNPAPT